MPYTYTADHEKAKQMQAFTASLFASSDPRAARLMDQFWRVSHRMFRLGEVSLHESGLSYAQYRLLLLLLFEEWSGNGNGMNPSTISDHQGKGRNTISALIRGLEDDGLVERRLDEQDRRRFNIALTEAGRQRVRQHTSLHMRFVGGLFAAFTPEEMDTLGTLLTKLNSCAESYKG